MTEILSTAAEINPWELSEVSGFTEEKRQGEAGREDERKRRRAKRGRRRGRRRTTNIDTSTRIEVLSHGVGDESSGAVEVDIDSIGTRLLQRLAQRCHIIICIQKRGEKRGAEEKKKKKYKYK